LCPKSRTHEEIFLKFNISVNFIEIFSLVVDKLMTNYIKLT